MSFSVLYHLATVCVQIRCTHISRDNTAQQGNMMTETTFTYIAQRICSSWLSSEERTHSFNYEQVNK